MSDCNFRTSATIISQVYNFRVDGRVADGCVLLAVGEDEYRSPTDDEEKPIEFAAWREFAAAVEERIQAYERSRAEATR